MAACWLLAPAPTREPLRSPAVTAWPRSLGGTYCESVTAAPATAATPTAAATFLRADTRVLPPSGPRTPAGRPGSTLGVTPGRHRAAPGGAATRLRRTSASPVDGDRTPSTAPRSGRFVGDITASTGCGGRTSRESASSRRSCCSSRVSRPHHWSPLRGRVLKVGGGGRPERQGDAPARLLERDPGPGSV